MKIGLVGLLAAWTAQAAPLDEGIEAILEQQLVQPIVERMTRGSRQVSRRYEQPGLPLSGSLSHRHLLSSDRFEPTEFSRTDGRGSIPQQTTFDTGC